MWVGVEQTAKGANDLNGEQCVPDLDALRNRLADLLDTYPMRDWPGPLLMAISGVVESAIIAHGVGLVGVEPRPPLRLVR